MSDRFINGILTGSTVDMYPAHLEERIFFYFIFFLLRIWSASSVFQL